MDKADNVDFSIADQNQGNIQTLLDSGVTWTPTNLTGSPKYSASARQMTLDVNGNLWGAEYGSAIGVEGGAVGVLPSVTTAPTYNDSNYPVQDTAVAGGTTGTSTGNAGALGIAVDANSNVWVSNVGEGTYSGVLGISEATAPTLYPIQSAPTASMVFSNALNTGIVSPKYMEVDGANNLWVADTDGYHEFSIANTSEISESGGFKPCYLGASGNATTCSASYDAQSRGVAVDSAGDVWTVYSDQLNASNKTQGRLYQIIGSGFPTWPLKAQQQPGFPAGCASKLVNGQCAATGTPSSISVNMASYAADCVGHSQSTLCIESLQDAIAVAASALALNGNVTYTINIPAGTFDLSDQGPQTEGGTVVDNQGNPILNSQGNPPSAVIVVDGIAPSGSGSLNILGAGSGSTALIISDFISEIEGTGVSHIHFGGMRWQTKDASTTQGTVTASGAGYITIQIPTGFPTPLALYDDVTGLSTQGRYLRVYDNSTPSQPVLNTSTANINQIPWGYDSNTSTYLPPVQVGANTWKLYFNNPNQVAPSVYTAANQIVCVKSKLAAQAYDFYNQNTFPGVDVGFNDFIWQDVSRGTWRNFTNVYVTNSKVVRRPPPSSNPTQGYCLSTAAGGPQYGEQQDTTYPVGYFYVNNYSADSTGDDSLAIFNDTTNTSIVTNTDIGNSFARDINLYQSCNVQLSNNTGYDCNPNVPWNVPSTYNGCITDTSPTECRAAHCKRCSSQPTNNKDRMRASSLRLAARRGSVWWRQQRLVSRWLRDPAR